MNTENRKYLRNFFNEDFTAEQVDSIANCFLEQTRTDAGMRLSPQYTLKSFLTVVIKSTKPTAEQREALKALCQALWKRDGVEKPQGRGNTIAVTLFDQAGITWQTLERVVDAPVQIEENPEAPAKLRELISETTEDRATKARDALVLAILQADREDAMYAICQLAMKLQ